MDHHFYLYLVVAFDSQLDSEHSYYDNYTAEFGQMENQSSCSGYMGFGER